MAIAQVSARPGAAPGHQGVADKRLHVPEKRLQESLRQGKLAAWKASGQ